MIKVKELRVGNLILDEEKNITKVAGIDWYGNVLKDCDTCDEPFTKLWEPFPIPLTPEILEKCGFVKSKEFYINKPIYVLVHDEGIEVTYSQICQPCKYLHQLQNLYFALTGAELKANLNAEVEKV